MAEPFPMDEYLTTIELSKRIKMAPGTIRNLVWKKELKENVHYLKPTPRKILYVWSEIQGWLHRGSGENRSRLSNQASSLINI